MSAMMTSGSDRTITEATLVSVSVNLSTSPTVKRSINETHPMGSYSTTIQLGTRNKVTALLFIFISILTFYIQLE